jgi:hypothetical protein
MAGDVIRGAGLAGSPVAFFLAMLAITLQVSGSVAQTQQHGPLHLTHCCFKQQHGKDQMYRFTAMIQSWWEASLMGA